jgi:hypothetical protein
MPCTGRVAITLARPYQSDRKMVRAGPGGRGTYLAEGVRVDMYRAEALEVGERGWREREGIRGVCGYAAQGEVADLRLRLEEGGQIWVEPRAWKVPINQRPQTFF